ncbi:hypothetical protein pdam_00017074 [Pocillopora damicornis]|uniref:F5/8 type C domain-containing protein n=1 Tax=Pocillopora damicornis TaxID=46731 RepID=A0A3M6UIL2_POCDA|nr:hypothetical protein pdam_00017074 [Pocillopora damicornis]
MTEPRLARLHELRNCHASWCGSVGAWLQIDLGRDYDINGINTQGARDNYGFVKKFTLAYKTTSGGWENFEEDGNVKGSCYWFSDHSQPQSHAVNTCRVRGADLPKVTSIEENNFLKKSGYSWWLDLRRDSTHKSIFRWSDGSLADFTNWKSGDHSDNSKECVEQEDTGEWNTVLCTTNQNIDVILATGTVSKRSAGIVFGFQEFTQTYHLSVSAGPHIWEARLPDYPLGWVHVGITWSNQWGLRFYQNGVLTVESTSPARLLYATESTFPRFYIGRESTTSPLKRTHNLQISDLRIWESVIPPEKMEDMQACSALPWYMWKNTGNYDYPWELKRVPRESPDEQRFDVIPQDTKYHNMGCFKIGSGPPIPSLEGTDPILNGNHVSRLGAVQKCLHAARRKGNKMFAVASGGKCLSAAVEYSDVEKSYTQTSHGCKNGKGATNYMNIYIVKDSNNAAFKKPTAQSGTIKASSFATDGSHYNINTEKCTKTTSQKDPWWRVDLEREVLVHDVYIYKHSYVSVNYLLQIRVGNHDNPNLKKNSPNRLRASKHVLPSSKNDSLSS